jgi:hypothetical protein
VLQTIRAAVDLVLLILLLLQAEQTAVVVEVVVATLGAKILQASAGQE